LRKSLSSSFLINFNPFITLLNLNFIPLANVLNMVTPAL
jgi:hypothetical protein